MLTLAQAIWRRISTTDRTSRMSIAMVCLLSSQFCACLPDPDRSLARYQNDALAYAEAEAAAYGAQWEAGLAGLWSGVRAAVVHVASIDSEGIYHDLAPDLEQAWSTRWPGLVPMRTSRSPNDTLLVLQAPEPLEGDQVLIQAQLFLGGEWSTHSIAIEPTDDGGWQAVGDAAVSRGAR